MPRYNAPMERAVRGRLCRPVLSAAVLMDIALIGTGAAQTPSPTLTTLYSFLGPPSDGGAPYAGLVADKAGSLFGTTSGSGPNGFGTAFQLKPPASPGGAWVETVIQTFEEGVFGGLVIGENGRLYGVTVFGGDYNAGTAFELTPPDSDSGAWVESVIYNFRGGSDGNEPCGTLITGKGGALYGTTFRGGTLNFGTVFELQPPVNSGGAWTENVIYSFTRTGDGEDATESVTTGEGGVLYGLAGGAIFELTPPASPGGPWTESTIGFTSGVSAPGAGLVIGAGGVLYGTTILPGGEDCKGSVFALTPPSTPGGAWTQAMIHSFREGLNGGGFDPYATLLVNKDGVLYGTTLYGGTLNQGTVFELFPPASPGDPWRERVLHNFTGVDGGQPQSWLIGMALSENS